MKLAFVAVIFVSCAVLTNGQFSKKLESLDVDSILKNDRILTNYVKCVLDKGPCTSEGRELRKTLPQVLKSGCDGCNESEKKNTRKVILHLQEKKPAQWQEVQDKFDPSGEDTIQFKKAVGV